MLLGQDLDKARKGLCLDSDLHLCYLITPRSEDVCRNWETCCNVIRSAQVNSIFAMVVCPLIWCDIAVFQDSLLAVCMFHLRPISRVILLSWDSVGVLGNLQHLLLPTAFFECSQ